MRKRNISVSSGETTPTLCQQSTGMGGQERFKIFRDQIKTPEVLLDLTNLNKGSTNNLVYQQYFGAFIEDYSNYEKIFTDGSKSDDAVGAASVTGKYLRESSRQGYLAAALSSQLS